jgi:hypothetical protein
MRKLQDENKLGLKVNFTELVYAVVIGNSFVALSLATTPIRLAMFFFALLIVLDDWVLYHLSVERIERTVKNYLLCFLLDVVVLITWYLLSVVPEGQLFKFLILSSIYFGITSLWEFTFDKFDFVSFLKNTDIILTIIYLVLATIFKLFQANDFLIVALCYAGFISFRFKEWMNLLQENNLEL